MSWVTFIWSMTAGICLTLGAVHFLVWTRQRDQWANLVFSLTAAAAAGYAVLDMVALRTRTPVEYGGSRNRGWGAARSGIRCRCDGGWPAPPRR